MIGQKDHGSRDLSSVALSLPSEAFTEWSYAGVYTHIHHGKTTHIYAIPSIYQLLGQVIHS